MVIGSVWKQQSLCSAHLPLKSADSSSMCNGFAMSFEAATSGYSHECRERFLHRIWRCCTKSSLVHEGILCFNFRYFLPPQDADSATHKAGVQPQRLHSGEDVELQLPEPGETFLVSQRNAQHSLSWVFVSAAGSK